jgi:ATP-binding cassette, subfamily B, bacterial PglK
MPGSEGRGLGPSSPTSASEAPRRPSRPEPDAGLRGWRRYLIFIEPGRRARWLGLVILAVVVSGLEALGAALIYLVLRFVAEPGAGLSVPGIGDLEGLFPQLDTPDLIAWSAGFMALFFLVRGFAAVGQAYVQGRVTEDAGVRLAGRLLMGYLRMPYPFHLRRNSAELMRNVEESVSRVVSSTLVPVMRLASEALVVAAVAIVLLVTAPVGLLVAAVVLVPVVLGLLRIVQPRIAVLGQQSHELGQTTLQSLHQSLHGFRDVKLLGRERYFHDRFHAAREGIARTRYLRRALSEMPRVSLETALVLFVLVLLVVTLRRGGSPQESLAVLGLFGYAALRILPALNRAVLQLNDLRYGAVAARKVYEELQVVQAADERGRRHAGEEPEPLALRERISVEGVHYRYEGAPVDALAGVDLTIRRGETIGLVGPSGGGKTTLVDVLLGLLPPSAGVVRVDGVDIQSCLPAWHRNLGVVPQAIYLLDDTLRRNIALGLDDHEIDEARVVEAVRMAQLEAFVAALPDGLDTTVGERGARVSGGQRQRIAIARALYRQPEVLVFDEGTSALDNLTEAELIEALEPLRGKRTMVIVAHRLTTVRRCDRIAFVRDGRIVDSGTYDDLLARSPAFQQLAR